MMYSGDEDCGDDCTSDAIHSAMRREEAANDTQLPAEVTQEPETPFDNERADIQYRESMKDAGRGHLLR